MGGRGSKGRPRGADQWEQPSSRSTELSDNAPPNPAPPTQQVPAPVPRPDAPIEEWDRHIVDAFKRLASTTDSEWVPLSELRKHFGDTPHDIQDTILKTWRRAHPDDVNFAPDSNRKALQPEDHDAALPIGGEPKHLLAIQRFDEHGNKIPLRDWCDTPAPDQPTDPT